MAVGIRRGRWRGLEGNAREEVRKDDIFSHVYVRAYLALYFEIKSLNL